MIGQQIEHPTGKPPEERTRLENRFWEKVDWKDKDECWDWTASAQRYGRFWLHTGNELAHRVAYSLHHDIALDDIPGDVVKHSCHDTQCVNPHHLRAGTQAENLTEAITDDDGDGDTRFSAGEIRDIKRLERLGRTQQDIADMFDVSVALISGIIRGEYYSWVE